MRISKVTTKSGDRGNTSLGNGERVSKSHLIINLLGDIDELNSHLGLALSSCKSKSIKLFKEGYLLTEEAMKWFWEKLRNTNEDNSNSLFNLMLFQENMKLSKTIIVTAGFDPLSDEAEEYAFKLHENGNYVKQLHYPSLFHGFASMTRLKTAKKARDKSVYNFIQWRHLLTLSLIHI